MKRILNPLVLPLSCVFVLILDMSIYSSFSKKTKPFFYNVFCKKRIFLSLCSEYYHEFETKKRCIIKSNCPGGHAWSSKLLVDALRHAREDPGHRVRAPSGVIFDKRGNLFSEACVKYLFKLCKKFFIYITKLLLKYQCKFYVWPE